MGDVEKIDLVKWFDQDPTYQRNIIEAVAEIMIQGTVAPPVMPENN